MAGGMGMGPGMAGYGAYGSGQLKGQNSQDTPPVACRVAKYATSIPYRCESDSTRLLGCLLPSDLSCLVPT